MTIFQTRTSAPPDPATQRPDVVGGGVWDALAGSSTLAAVANMVGDFNYPSDPNWQLTDDNFGQYTQGISPEYWPQFGYAVSDEHAREIRDRMMTEQWANQRIAQMGSWAIPAKAGFSLIDPPQAAAMLLTGGIGSLGNIAVKGERLAAAVRAGLVGAGVNMAMTAVEATQRPTVDANDVLRSGLMGFGFGVAGPATAGASRTARFFKGGAYSAAPTLVYDAAGRVTGLSDTDSRDMQATAIQNFLMGGFFNALPKTRPITEVDNAFQKAAMIRDRAADEFTEKLAISMYKKIQFKDIAEQARAQGKTPREMLSPKGLVEFSDELAALHENRTGVTVPDDAFLIQPGDPVQAKAQAITDTPSGAIGAASINDLKPNKVYAVYNEKTGRLGAPLTGEAQLAVTGKLDLVDSEYLAFHQKRADAGNAESQSQVNRLKAKQTSTRFVEVLSIEGQAVGEPTPLLPTTDTALIGREAKQPWEMTSGEWRDWSNRPEHKVERAQAEKVADDAMAAVVKLEEEVGTASKSALGSAGSAEGISPQAFGLAALADELRAQAEFDEAFSKMPEDFKQRHAAAVKKYEVAHARYKTFESLRTAQEMIKEHPELALESQSPNTALIGRESKLVTVPDDAFLIQPGDPVQAKAQAITDTPSGAIGAASINDPAFLAIRPEFDTARGKRPGDLFVGQYQSDAMPRFNAWARLGLSEAGFAPAGEKFGPIRQAYNTLIYDAIPKQDWSMGGEVASWSYGQRTAGRAENIRTEIDTHAKHAEWAKANGQKPLSLEDFGNKVTEYRRSRGTMHADDPGVVEAHSRLFSKFYPDELGRQQRHGVPNAENVPIDPWHTPRVWHDHKVDLERNRAGHAGIRAGIAKNLTGDMPQSRRLAIAEALLRRQLNRFFGTPTSRGGILDGDAADLEAAIREAEPGISDADLRDIIYYKAEAAPDGTPKYLRRRIGLDENGVMELVDQATGEKYTRKVSDLLYNNAFELGRRYVEHSVGNSSLSEVFRAMTRQNEVPAKTIPEFIDRMRARMESEGVPIDEYQKHLDRIETALKRIGGLPVRKTGDLDLALKAVGDVEFARTMSNITSGIQNLQQVGEALASQTLDVAMTSIPEIANIRDMMKRTDGKLDNRFLREAAALGIAEGTMARRPRMFLPDDSLGQVTKARKAAYWTSRAAKVASMVSGQDASAQMNSTAAAVVYKNTWADMAFGGRALDSGQNLQRLNDSSLTPEMGNRIKAMIQKYAITEQGNGGTKVKSFETADWKEDPEAASAFNIRMARFVERVTGEGNPTSDPLWMSNSFIKLFGQLRGYVSRQWQNKTLYATDQARQGNIGAMSRVAVTTTAWAAALYMARVYVQSIGRDDREDYLDKMLDHKKIAIGAIGRNDTVSLLPWFVDVAALGTGAPEPVFAFARASEMREAKGRFAQMFGSPVTSHLEAVYGATGALGGSLFYDDYMFSRDDLNNVSNGFAIPNALNIKTWAQREISKYYSLPAKSRPFQASP